LLLALPDADIFMSSPGAVMVLSKRNTSSFYTYIKAKGNSFIYDTSRCIVTSITIAESTNYQFMNTLNSYVYLYTFGDKISELDVTGVMFLNGECDGKSGFFSAYDFYDNNKVSKGVTAEVTLSTMGSVGSLAYTYSPCFLTNMTISITDPSTMIGNFSFKMHYMPNV